jgi:hypothetical protein
MGTEGAGSLHRRKIPLLMVAANVTEEGLTAQPCSSLPGCPASTHSPGPIDSWEKLQILKIVRVERTRGIGPVGGGFGEKTGLNPGLERPPKRGVDLIGPAGLGGHILRFDEQGTWTYVDFNTLLAKEAGDGRVRLGWG